MNQSHIREWDLSNCLIDFKWAPTRTKKTREIKDAEQRRKLSTQKQTCSNLKEHLIFYWKVNVTNKGVGKLLNKKVLQKLVYLINSLEEIKNGT